MIYTVLGRDQHLFCYLDGSWLCLIVSMDADGEEHQELTECLSRYFCPHYVSPVSPGPSLPLKSIRGQPGSILATASAPGGEIRKRLVELWLLILAKTKSPLRTALLESVDSNWHLRSMEMKPEEDRAARETTEVSVFWQPKSEERGMGVRVSVSCRVPSLWRDHSSLQRVGREVGG